RTSSKTFNWQALPTELKEHILTFCLHQSPPPGLSRRTKGAPEVTGQLGDWDSLLSVSRQVRTLCLRLCLSGSSSLVYKHGLCIDVDTHRDFKDCIRRLGKYFQLLEPNSLPHDATTQLLAKTYRDFPLAHAHLARYATLRHGIRKLHLEFSFLDCMHFFRVTVAHFPRFYPHFRLDYRVLDSLSGLVAVAVRLPDPTGYLVDRVPQCGPRLFYGDPYTCPRILHRVIYEAAAEAMAPCGFFALYGFMDYDEKARFEALRASASAKVKFTTDQLGELYAEDQPGGGGVQLGEWIQPGVDAAAAAAAARSDVDEELDFVRDTFWPPKCRCKVRCSKVL
ncbi:uncharacterized protein SETTUDRAFT_64978, partial [Exserohilum turcica Et28A]